MPQDPFPYPGIPSLSHLLSTRTSLTTDDVRHKQGVGHRERSKNNDTNAECLWGMRMFKSYVHWQGHICFLSPCLCNQHQCCPCWHQKKTKGQWKASMGRALSVGSREKPRPPLIYFRPTSHMLLLGKAWIENVHQALSNCPTDAVWHGSIGKPNVPHHALNMSSVPICINVPICVFLRFLRIRLIIWRPMVAWSTCIQNSLSAVPPIERRLQPASSWIFFPRMDF